MHVLRWTIAEKSENDYFIIERKFESEDFQTIGTMAMTEADANQTNYEYSDRDITGNGIYFYRLKQVRNTGTHLYNKIVRIFVFGE